MWVKGESHGEKGRKAGGYSTPVRPPDMQHWELTRDSDLGEGIHLSGPLTLGPSRMLTLLSLPVGYSGGLKFTMLNHLHDLSYNPGFLSPSSTAPPNNC